MDSSPPQQKTTTGSGHHHQPKSSSELMASGKLVAEAAQSTFTHGSAVDKAKLADAASDLLEGGCQYGKLEDGKFGQYVEKAEIYLDKYGQSTDGHSSAAGHGGVGTTKPATGHGGGTTTTHSGGGYEQSDGKTHTSSESGGGGDGKSEGGYGQYFKMAEGFLKK